MGAVEDWLMEQMEKPEVCEECGHQHFCDRGECGVDGCDCGEGIWTEKCYLFGHMQNFDEECDYPTRVPFNEDEVRDSDRLPGGLFRCGCPTLEIFVLETNRGDMEISIMEGDIQAMFCELDSLYFHGQLQIEGWAVVAQTVVHHETGETCHGYCDAATKTIFISPHTPHDKRDTLLHEMAHAASDREIQEHGPGWWRVMGNLIRRGEAQLLPEVRAYYRHNQSNRLQAQFNAQAELFERRAKRVYRLAAQLKEEHAALERLSAECKRMSEHSLAAWGVLKDQEKALDLARHPQP